MDIFQTLISSALVVICTAHTQGEIITFDEFDVDGHGIGLTDQYAHLGVLFESDMPELPRIRDRSGSFDWDGSNGPQFLGYSLARSSRGQMVFDNLATDIQLDIIQLPRESWFFTVQVTGWLDDIAVETVVVPASVEGGWATASLNGIYDSISVRSSGLLFNFSVDNFRWTPVPAPSSLSILLLSGIAIPRQRRA